MKNYLMAGLALAMLAACDGSVAAPEYMDGPELAMVANPLATRADYEAQFCGMEPMQTNVQPGWPYIFGTDGDDHIRAGDDFAVRINARAGNDCLVGGMPNNTLFGEDGDDLLLGGGGDDYLSGGPGADVMYGDDGDDIILADDGFSDVVFAGNGTDVVRADDGVADEIDCGAGRDVAFVDAFDTVMRCEVINPANSW
jgi:Ca2+-binding RTX toxin-like protein